MMDLIRQPVADLLTRINSSDQMAADSACLLASDLFDLDTAYAEYIHLSPKQLRQFPTPEAWTKACRASLVAYREEYSGQLLLDLRINRHERQAIERAIATRAMRHRSLAATSVLGSVAELDVLDWLTDLVKSELENRHEEVLLAAIRS